MADEIKTELNLEAMHPLIRDWVGSETLTLRIMDLNKRLGFQDWQRAVIPEMIMRLVLKELEPENLIIELSRELDIDISSAQMIANEIRDSLLKPIATILLNYIGLDLQKISLPPSETIAPPKAAVPPTPPIEPVTPPTSPVEPVEIEKPIQTVSLPPATPLTQPITKEESSKAESPIVVKIKPHLMEESAKTTELPTQNKTEQPVVNEAIINQPQPVRVSEIKPPAEKKESEPSSTNQIEQSVINKTQSSIVNEAEPFMLHQTTSITKPATKKEETIKPTFQFIQPSIEKQPATKPVIAEVQIPTTQSAAQRIVHYSPYKTPLNPFERGEKK